jgi:hypothetical protein
MNSSPYMNLEPINSLSGYGSLDLKARHGEARRLIFKIQPYYDPFRLPIHPAHSRDLKAFIPEDPNVDTYNINPADKVFEICYYLENIRNQISQLAQS